MAPALGCCGLPGPGSASTKWHAARWSRAAAPSCGSLVRQTWPPRTSTARQGTWGGSGTPRAGDAGPFGSPSGCHGDASSTPAPSCGTASRSVRV